MNTYLDLMVSFIRPWHDSSVLTNSIASWWDHGRDLLYLINQFQDEMPHPLIGVGHSVGASHLYDTGYRYLCLLGNADNCHRMHLSLFHPRLLDSLIFVDPIMQQDLKPHKSLAGLSTFRRDVWPSREAAAEKFRSNKFYQAWDPRVLEKWLKYGLRDLPTEKYPELPIDSDAANPPVTLSTTTDQEVYLYQGALYRDDRLLQDDDLLQDIRPECRDERPFGRPECQELHRRLPEVNPSVLFVFGSQSMASPPEYQDDKIQRTGTGVGGSGGAAKGKVQGVALDCGHLVGMEDPKGCAKACASFMNAELEKWEIREREFDKRLKGLNRAERVGINELWKQNINKDLSKPTEKESKL